jgi:16S rRNA (cytidine1402-2'-O)-methyltransferase
VLREVSAIACEDTRHTGLLCARFEIATPRVSLHAHNEARRVPELLERLERGEAIALVSDAGTPLVSDPGFRLVQEALEKGVHVTSVPGPSAVLAALVVAGLPTDRFFFEGFLPHKSGPRRARLAELAQIPGTLVFFESPRRLVETLADCAAVLGGRNAAIARELTKMFESVRRGTLDELAATLAKEEPPKGEIVLLVAPPGAGAAETAAADLDAKIEEALTAHSVKDAASVVSAATGQPRRQVYARALELAAAKQHSD